MANSQYKRFSQARSNLRKAFLLFCIALILLISLVVKFVQNEFENRSWEEASQTVLLSSERFMERLSERLQEEFVRPASDYSFFSAAENQILPVEGVSFSPLATLSHKSKSWGVEGYFQLNSNSELSSPILPRIDLQVLNESGLDIGVTELEQRSELFNQLQSKLKKGQTTWLIPAPERENISTEKFQILELPSGSLVFFRTILLSNEPVNQGFIVDPQQLLNSLANSITARQGGTELHSYTLISDKSSSKLASYSFERKFRADTSEESINATLARPLSGYYLRFELARTGLEPVFNNLYLLTVVLLAVLVGGLLALYRLVTSGFELAEARQNFVSAISHELRTPLTSIRMYAEMLQRGWVDKNNQKEYAGFITSESERLSRMIERILQFSKLGQKKYTLSPTNISSKELCGLLKEKITPLLQASQFQLTVSDNVGEPQRVEVDLDLLVQVFLNLAENSVKFANRAERKELVLECSSQSSNLCITLRDFGPGIDIDNPERVFELFYRAESELTRESKGVGLGLALVKEICEVLGCQISFSKKSPGVEWLITIPILDN